MGNKFLLDRHVAKHFKNILFFITVTLNRERENFTIKFYTVYMAEVIEYISIPYETLLLRNRTQI